jgi:hypothetical protein
MAARDDSDKGRHVYGPRPLGALVPGIARPAFRRRSPAAAQIIADWPAIVGPALAAAAQPRKLSGGTLTLGCQGPQAVELQHYAPALIGRINAHLGSVAVERLRFVQERAAAPPPAPVPATPTVAVPQVAALPEGALRDALERLGRAVLTQAARE